jgi:hypothetical protein
MVKERLRVTEYILVKHPSISERKTLIWKGHRAPYMLTLDAYFLNQHEVGSKPNAVFAGT